MISKVLLSLNFIIIFDFSFAVINDFSCKYWAFDTLVTPIFSSSHFKQKCKNSIKKALFAGFYLPKCVKL